MMKIPANLSFWVYAPSFGLSTIFNTLDRSKGYLRIGPVAKRAAETLLIEDNSHFILLDEFYVAEMRTVLYLAKAFPDRKFILAITHSRYAELLK